jgi:glycosyltransferase involved in cell wall biosynthesis
VSKRVEVLIPTYNRPTALAVTLTGVLHQTFRDLDVIVSDQTEGASVLERPEVQSIARLFRQRGQQVTFHHHLPRRGVAEHRHFLLSRSQAPYVLFLDDDILMEPEVVERLVSVLEAEGCGFVGAAPSGPRFLDDVRPHEQHVELWEGPVRPEAIAWDTVPWERHHLHNAANPHHLGRRFAPDGCTRRYKVAWVGACVLYDRVKLLEVGGYGWWRELPPEHCGEDVLVQLLLLRRYGGCGVLPSGTWHLDLPTQIPDRRHNTDDLIRRYLDQPAAAEEGKP